jgi:murein tripeptide amidase MpaA
MLSVCFSILLASPVEVYERYDDNMVIRMNIDSAMAAERLDTVINQNPSYSVWSDAELGNVDIMIPKANMDDLKSKLNGVDVQVLIPNLQDLIDQETEHSAKHSALVTKAFQSKGVVPSAQELFKDYQDSDVYLAFLESLPETTPISIGTSFEGRKFRGVKFGNGPKNIVFHGGIHAREWVTGAVTTFIAHQLLGNSTEAVELRSKFTFSVIPVLNVDGYAYSRTRKRLWRKNRQETWDFSCFGIDINRNFPYKWRNGGSSGDECKETFRGEKPLEAQESIALYEYVKSLENVVSYIDFHSYSQIWMVKVFYVASIRL